MKKSDILSIALKLFGLHLLIQTIMLVQQFIVVCYTISSSPSMDHSGTVSMILGFVCTIAVQLLLSLALIFQSHRLARKITRYEEDAALNTSIDKQAGLEIAIFVIGGLVVTGAISSMGYHVIQAVEAAQANVEPTSKGFAQIIWQFILVVIGFFIVAARRSLAEYFIRRDKET